MSHSNIGSVFIGVLKALLFTVLKLAGLAIAFSCKLLAMVLYGISDFLTKLVGHGSNH